MNGVKQDHKIVEEIYPVICSSLDELLIFSNSDIKFLKQIIKEQTYLYLLDSGYLFVSEGFSEVSNTIKTVFWSTTLNLWTGKISIGNWLSGIGLNVALTRSFEISSIGSTLFSEILKKVGLTTAATGAATAGTVVANTFLLRALNVAIFPSVLLGLVIYKLVKYNDILVIKNFETLISSIITRLQLSKSEDFKTITNELNTKYESILKNECSNISNSESKLKCASNNYIKYITEIVLRRLISGYIVYLKKNNLDIRYIETFHDLCYYQFTSSIFIKQFEMLYVQYIKILDIYVFDQVYRQRYISLLNKHTFEMVKSL